MINRIQSALRSTLNIEDIHAILLSTLVSDEGFGFSRAFLLAFDPAREELSGIGALGAENAEQHERLRREIHLETRKLAHMVRDLNSTCDGENVEETILARSLRDLSSNAFWITTHQVYSSSSSLDERVRRLRLSCGEPATQSGKRSRRWLDQIMQGTTATAMTRKQLEQADLPAAFLELLPGTTIWTGVRTQKGLRLVVIVDRLFDSQPPQPIDLLHVDWIAGQAALGLEIAEIHQDLEFAYRELQDLDRMKSNFLATVSHELRTPLTAINGYLQLLLANRLGAVSQGQREVLERVMEHSELLTGKVNDLIEIAELDMGDDTGMPIEAVDPLVALVHSMQRVESRRARRQTTIEPHVEQAIPRIRANPAALERIFFHLLDNALKFGRDGGRVVVEFSQEGAELRMSVIDDGIGIAPDHLQRIFSAFYQIDNQLTRSYEGLGIGLTVIKRQLEATGVRFEVRSEPGAGSSFSVYYPLA